MSRTLTPPLDRTPCGYYAMRELFEKFCEHDCPGLFQKLEQPGLTPYQQRLVHTSAMPTMERFLNVLIAGPFEAIVRDPDTGQVDRIIPYEWEGGGNQENAFVRRFGDNRIGMIDEDEDFPLSKYNYRVPFVEIAAAHRAALGGLALVLISLAGNAGGGERTKNRLPHIVPLVQMSKELLEQRRGFDERWVFPSPAGLDQPVTMGSRNRKCVRKASGVTDSNRTICVGRCRQI